MSKKVYIVLCSDNDKEGFSEIVGVTNKENETEKMIKRYEKSKNLDGTRNYSTIKFNI